MSHVWVHHDDDKCSVTKWVMPLQKIGEIMNTFPHQSQRKLIEAWVQYPTVVHEYTETQHYMMTSNLLSINITMTSLNDHAPVFQYNPCTAHMS